MFDQLNTLVKQYGLESVINNAHVPNDKNDAVISEAGNSLFEGLKNMVSQGNFTELASLFQGDKAITSNNPVVQQLAQHVSGNLNQKLGLSTETATGIAGSLIPKVLGSLIGNAKDSNQSGFNISDLVNAISGGKGSAGLMDAISKYGGQFGLDQNGDGKVDMSDAMAAVSKKSGGLGGLLGKLFGGK
jgi:uncharacterized membrane protein YeaQ/YmgE (transglycosylase-associated protein family)